MNRTNPIPERTIERMVLYKRILTDLQSKGVVSLFSHQLAELAHNTSTQVRRDLMEIGYSGSPRKGYQVADLINAISTILDGSQERVIALVGVGNLGRAILSYFTCKRAGLSIAAAFDADERRVNRVVSGCRCYHLDQFENVVKEKRINLGIITVPAAAAQSVADRMTGAGLRGILNFAPVPLRVPDNVFVDRIDIASALEKLAYFSGLE
ncbi:MAG: redox-sensing transcriptional repressor Rex [Lentisphaeria bacterium]|nr:redox-sensing transcriptional repressor Rex [Lentisphaeria bacterium]